MSAARSASIRIGTAGWSYPTGKGTWKGLFYPPKQPRVRVDELAYYAEHFDTVEVNSSFYRPPTPVMAKRWAERTPRRFEFAVKLYQKFTHPEMFAKATGLRLTLRSWSLSAEYSLAKSTYQRRSVSSPRCSLM